MIWRTVTVPLKFQDETESVQTIQTLHTASNSTALLNNQNTALLNNQKQGVCWMNISVRRGDLKKLFLFNLFLENTTGRNYSERDRLIRFYFSTMKM